MSKERNDLFVVIIFGFIWIIHPISYDEMRIRHPIYPSEVEYRELLSYGVIL